MSSSSTPCLENGPAGSRCHRGILPLPPNCGRLERSNGEHETQFSQTTDRGERGEAAFCNVSLGVTFVVIVVGCAYLFGGENAFEPEYTFGWTIEIGRRIDARVHQADELGGVDLRAWNMNS